MPTTFCPRSSQRLVCNAGEQRKGRPGPSSSILCSLRVRGDEEALGVPLPPAHTPPPSTGPGPPTCPLSRALLPPHSPSKLSWEPHFTQGSPLSRHQEPQSCLSPGLLLKLPSCQTLSQLMPLSPAPLKPNAASDPFPSNNSSG